MTSPQLVSIVVRTQGRRLGLLSKALASLAAQSYPALEVLVVEDGSAAAAAAVDVANTSRSGVFAHVPIDHVGRSGAGNTGLERARGVFLGFLDEDDDLAPDHLSVLVDALNGAPLVNLAYARSTPLYCDGLEGDAPQDLATGSPTGDLPFSRTLLWLRNGIAIQAALFRRTLFDQLGGFDLDLDALEDWDLWLRYSRDTEFLAVNATTSRYRLPAAKATLQARAEAHQLALAQVAHKHRGMTAHHRFEDINALPDHVRSEIPFRQALALARRALLAKFTDAKRTMRR